jgi:hypothetical protein
MVRSRATPVLVLSTLIAVSLCSRGQEDHASVARLERHVFDNDYESWIQPYRQLPVYVDSISVPGNRGEVTTALLKITAVEGDDLLPDQRTAEIFGKNHRIALYGCSVSMEGRISSFRHDWGGFKGGGYPLLRPEVFSELKQLAANLPDDYSHLPPPGRRLVIQVSTPPIVRVYDRANLPDDVLDILHLVGAGVEPWILRLKPEPRIAPDGTVVTPTRIPVRPTMSPDGSIGVLQGDFKVLIIDGQTSSPLRWLSEPDIGRRLIRLSDPYFTPDGSYLILRSSLPAVVVFDTKTWQQVPGIPDVPASAIAYFPAPNWQRAIVLSDTGTIGLWTPGARAATTTLATGEDLLAVSYSPDASQVIVATRSKNGTNVGAARVGLWSTNDGSFRTELHPPDYVIPTSMGFFPDGSHMFAWWPDGEYVFTTARTNSHSSGNGLALWNTHSGRYRVALEGCSGAIDRYAMNPESGRITVECYSGEVLTFDAASAITKAKDFEESLAAQK